MKLTLTNAGNFNSQNKIKTQSAAMSFNELPRLKPMTKDTVSFGCLAPIPVQPIKSEIAHAFKYVAKVFSQLKGNSIEAHGIDKALDIFSKKAAALVRSIKNDFAPTLKDLEIPPHLKTFKDSPNTVIRAYRNGAQEGKDFVVFERYTHPEYEFLDSLSVDPRKGTFILKAIDADKQPVVKKIEYIKNPAIVSLERYPDNTMVGMPESQSVELNI